MKKIVMLSVLVCLILISSPAIASDVDVQILPESMTVESGSVANFQILVNNGLDSNIELQFNVIGPYLTWITQPGIMTVDAYGSKTTSIVLRPVGENPGVYDYTVKVSVLNRQFETQTSFAMEVVNPVDIKSMFVSNNLKEVSAYVTFTSIMRQEATAILKIVNRDGVKSVKSESFPIVVEGDKTIVESVSLDGVVAGDYSLVAAIEGTGVELSRDFTLVPVQDVQKTTDVVDSAFGREITVTITNNGNVIEYDLQATEETSGVTGLVVKPAECFDAGGERTVCATNIDRLEPGQSVSITYMIEYWPSYAAWVAGIFIVLVIIAFSFMRVTAPKIRKRHISSAGNMHTVALEIKNPFSRKKLRNVIIRDWVSPLAKVIHKEAGALRPIVRRTEAGTELIWKIGDIIGKEERLITYKLQSFVEGELRMPRAYLRYRDDNERGSRVFSNSLVIS